MMLYFHASILSAQIAYDLSSPKISHMFIFYFIANLLTHAFTNRRIDRNKCPFIILSDIIYTSIRICDSHLSVQQHMNTWGTLDSRPVLLALQHSRTVESLSVPWSAHLTAVISNKRAVQPPYEVKVMLLSAPSVV